MSAILFPKVIRPERRRRRKWRRERKEKREGGRHRRLQAVCPSVHPESGQANAQLGGPGPSGTGTGFRCPSGEGQTGKKGPAGNVNPINREGGAGGALPTHKAGVSWPSPGGSHVGRHKSLFFPFLFEMMNV